MSLDAKNKELTHLTLSHYENNPQNFWQGTKDHDVSQNYQNFLKAIELDEPYRILDFGCGPGRDLAYFKSIGHEPVGLDGCEAFCSMARAHSGCEVWHQNFISLKLPPNFFHGIFANASLFHVPKASLFKVLKELYLSLRAGGILFSSNPRGQGESVTGGRYGHFMEIEDYQPIVESVGFQLIHHYYRPEGVPAHQAPWLACVLKKNHSISA